MVTINNSGVSEAINGEALDGSADGSPNEWRRGPGLSREMALTGGWEHLFPTYPLHQ
jgi:hypothetical protein